MKSLKKQSDRLFALIKQSSERVRNMSPEEYDEMINEQYQSWVRGMTARCEHGWLDFEQCPDCREKARKRAGGKS